MTSDDLQRLAAAKGDSSYDPDQMHWDGTHRFNAEGRYCYCGGDRTTATMFCCGRCFNWFHYLCLKKRPAYRVVSSDYMYMFTCDKCSPTGEHFQLLNKSMSQMLEIVLYHTTSDGQDAIGIGGIRDFFNRFTHSLAHGLQRFGSDSELWQQAVLTLKSNKLFTLRQRKGGDAWSLRVYADPANAQLGKGGLMTGNKACLVCSAPPNKTDWKQCDLCSRYHHATCMVMIESKRYRCPACTQFWRVVNGLKPLPSIDLARSGAAAAAAAKATAAAMRKRTVATAQQPSAKAQRTSTDAADPAPAKSAADAPVLSSGPIDIAEELLAASKIGITSTRARLRSGGLNSATLPIFTEPQSLAPGKSKSSSALPQPRAADSVLAPPPGPVRTTVTTSTVTSAPPLVPKAAPVRAQTPALGSAPRPPARTQQPAAAAAPRPPPASAPPPWATMLPPAAPQKADDVAALRRDMAALRQENALLTELVERGAQERARLELALTVSRKANARIVELQQKREALEATNEQLRAQILALVGPLDLTADE
jgi:hypothetical protein